MIVSFSFVSPDSPRAVIGKARVLDTFKDHKGHKVYCCEVLEANTSECPVGGLLKLKRWDIKGA